MPAWSNSHVFDPCSLRKLLKHPGIVECRKRKYTEGEYAKNYVQNEEEHSDIKFQADTKEKQMHELVVYFLFSLFLMFPITQPRREA